MARQSAFEQDNELVTLINMDDEYHRNNDPTDADAKTDAIAAALNDDPHAFLNVSRQSDGGRSPMEFVGRFPADKFDFGQLQIHLQDNYGGGDYRCMLYVKGKVKANKLLTIASPKMKQESSDSNLMIMRMMDRMEKMQNQIVQIMQEKNGGGNSRMEFMQELMMMKQIFANETKPTGGIKDIIDTIGSLRDLGLNIGGVSEPEEKGFGDLMALAAPVLQNLTTPQPAPVYAPNPAPKPVPTPEQLEARKMTMMLRMGISQLIAAAQRDKDHEAYATLVIDNVPADKINEFFNSPNGFAELCKIAPEAANYMPWFADLAEHVKAQLGMPSKVSDLYEYDEDDNVEDNSSTIDTGDGKNNLHNEPNS